MRRIWSLGFVGFVVGCHSAAPRPEVALAGPRQPASVLDARSAFSYQSEGQTRLSKFRQCLYQNSRNEMRSAEMSQFVIARDAAGFAQRDVYDDIERAVPCPRLVQREGSLGWNVVALTRFRRDERWFQCEYAVRGDVFLCELELPAYPGR